MEGDLLQPRLIPLKKFNNNNNNKEEKDYRSKFCQCIKPFFGRIPIMVTAFIFFSVLSNIWNSDANFPAFSVAMVKIT